MAFATAAMLVVTVVGVEEGSSGKASVLIGPIDGAALLAFSMFVALLVLSIGIWSVGVPRWMLPLSILGGVIASAATALAGFTVLMTTDASVLRCCTEDARPAT